VLHTEQDGFTSGASVDTLTGIIDKNMELLQAPKENGRVGHRAI
jgi:hypothetical protein